ncbi:MAG: hypothetical protein K2M27_00040 [Muribaculaceae bacterium]|nr:hypothetical protein [Muribaculaceae bacterium]
MNCDIDKYPYFIYPAVVALRESRENAGNQSLTDEELSRLRRFVAANVGDITALRRILDIDPEEFASFYPDMLSPSLSTNDTIDSFLSHFGNADAPTPRAAAEIPVESMTYSLEETTADMAPSPAVDDTAAAIDSFLAASAPASPAPASKTDFSEANARILIKNHDYQAALEIIQHLSLNNPEKSIYFADQIRFLRKLILIQAHDN